MSSLKKYNFSPEVRGKTLPEGFSVVKFTGEQDMVARCQNVVNTLKIPSIMLLDNDRNEMYELHCK